MPFCAITKQSFEIPKEDLEFYDRISPVILGQKYSIPPPKLSPDGRLFRRFAFRNQIHVFKRKSSTTRKEIFSMFPEGTSFPVIERDEWWGDSWDAVSYGRDFDFSRPFFEQFFALRDAVPHAALCTADLQENCTYVNHTGWSKNCYFTFNCSNNQDCMYLETCENATNCVDCSRTTHSELCYDCVECHRCYAVQSSIGCEDCRDSYYLLECRSCENCFGCSNLRRAKFHIFNRKVSEAEYWTFIKSIDLSRYSVRQEYWKKANDFFKNLPHPHIIGNRIENVTGNYIYESRNVLDSYSVHRSEDLRYCQNIDIGAKSCYDVSIWGHNMELGYEDVCCGGEAFNLLFCYECWLGVRDLIYCGFCIGCSNCFGCVGLQKKQYCIFNKQFTKETYFPAIAKLISHMQKTGEWGEFFPAKYSHAPINTTLVQRYFPLTKDEAIALGLSWYEAPDIIRPTAITAENLPDCLPEDNTSIEVIGLNGGKPFLVSSKEIQELRKLSAPIPRIRYDLRMEERQRRVAGIHLYPNKCAKTGKALRCSYPPNSDWIIWDKEVFDREFNS